MPFVARNQLIPFSEDIPDPNEVENWIPCDDQTLTDGIDRTVQEKLSCIAKEHEIYVVVNVVDYKVGISIRLQ